MKENSQIIVVGLGRFGSNVARTLYQLGHDVLAIDKEEIRVQSMMGEVTYPVTGDATEESVLRELGVQNFNIGVVGIGTNIESSIMVSVLLKETMKIDTVVSRASTRLHGSALELIGCDRVIYAEEEMGVQLAHNLFNPDVEEYMQIAPTYGINKLSVTERFVGMNLKEAGFSNIRYKYGVTIIVLKRGDNIILSPDSGEEIKEGDEIIVSGLDEHISKLID